MFVEVALSWAVPAVLLAMVILLLYLYGSWTFSTWSLMGVPGPAPSLFLGNTREFANNGVTACQMQWTKEFGKTFGIYLFRRPALMTSDVEILKEVLIKDFNNFIERGNVPALQLDILLQSVLFSNGDTWRRQRQTMTPTFSAAKLKHMNGFISRCCHNLVNSIRKTTKANTPLDVKKTFGSFTLDVIAGTGFGFETNCLDQPDDNEFLNCIRDLLVISSQLSPIGVLAACFPALSPVLKKMASPRKNRKENLNFIINTIRAALQERKKETGKGRSDLLQLMVDAETTQAEVQKNPNVKCLTADEIIAQGLIFYIAGYETTATTLQYLSYLLALNPDKQEKLYDEIEAAIGDAEPCYENVSEISYLDNCIRETLRCFPPAPIFGRRAVESRTIKGITIPAGGSVMVPVYALMRDEDYFPQPEKFIPERFEKDSEVQIPALVKDMVFGAGPRQCIGMRLALYEAKMAVVAAVRNFRFIKIKETPETISFSKATNLSAPTTTILVGTELRE